MSTLRRLATFPRPGAPGRGRPTLSMEFFPPRTAEAAGRARAAVGVLPRIAPDFVSVTYGTGGGAGSEDRRPSHDMVRELAGDLGVPTMAHLTCAGRPAADVEAEVAAFLTEGATAFLAMGGAPGGAVDRAPGSTVLRRADELVALLRTGPAADRGVAVTAFPADRPGSGRERELLVLASKQRAGADLAVTQLFFDPDDYFGLVRDARDAGITLPILPGILAPTSAGLLRRMAGMAGHPAPAELEARLDAADPASARRIGIRAAADLGRALVAGGAPGLHLFTMNDAEASEELVSALGL